MADTKQLLPATLQQKKAIDRLLDKGSGDETLPEYKTYLAEPTRAHADTLLTALAEKHQTDFLSDRENYIHYIAYRPHAERIGTHGLFTTYGEPIVLNQAAKEVAAHPGRVWTAIFSLTRRDAERLGYDNAACWQALLNANASLIAEKMHIEPNNLKWYAAYHDEGNHPHVHFVAYAEKPAGEYLTQNCVVQIRSALARQIFKDELQQIYEQQTVQRDALGEKAAEQFHAALAALHGGTIENEKLDKLIQQLSDRLRATKGKKVYGYLPPQTKLLVDQIVDALASDEKVAATYAAWGNLRQQVLHTYTDEVTPLPPLSQQPEFKKIRNMVAREVWQMIEQPVDTTKQNRQNCEKNKDASKQPNASEHSYISSPDYAQVTIRLLHQLEKLFTQNEPHPRIGLGATGRIDRKRRRQLRQKKIALGLAEDDTGIKL